MKLIVCTAPTETGLSGPEEDSEAGVMRRGGRSRRGSTTSFAPGDEHVVGRVGGVKVLRHRHDSLHKGGKVFHPFQSPYESGGRIIDQLKAE